MNERAIQAVGWAASIAAVLMYVAYVDQIVLNLQGQKGSIVQPAAAVVNCALWVVYAAGRTRKDWPIIIANVPGVVLGSVSVLTAL